MPTPPMLDKLDMYLIAGTFFFTMVAGATAMLYFRRFPSVETLLQVATIFNLKGGIILSLWIAWWATLLITVFFGTWVIVRGVDPQHAVVITILGMLVSQAFGNVNGALFKTMTWEDPKPANQASSTTTTKTETATTP